MIIYIRYVSRTDRVVRQTVSVLQGVVKGRRRRPGQGGQTEHGALHVVQPEYTRQLSTEYTSLLSYFLSSVLILLLCVGLEWKPSEV